MKPKELIKAEIITNGAFYKVLAQNAGLSPL